jgi:hypothetical protein
MLVIISPYIGFQENSPPCDNTDGSSAAGMHVFKLLACGLRGALSGDRLQTGLLFLSQDVFLSFFLF